MRKARMVSTILSIVGIMMISIALIVDNEQSYNEANKIQFTEPSYDGYIVISTG